VSEHPSWAVTGYEGLRNDPLILRNRARVNGHLAFDRLWEDAPGASQIPHVKRERRGQAYAWLANAMGLSVGACHFSVFTPEQCARAIVLCRGVTHLDVRSWCKSSGLWRNV
jgi:hypothetical protein